MFFLSNIVIPPPQTQYTHTPYSLAKQNPKEVYGRANESELLTYDVAEGMDAIIQLPLLDFAFICSSITSTTGAV